MMTPEQIAAMQADAEAGTPGPWEQDGIAIAHAAPPHGYPADVCLMGEPLQYPGDIGRMMDNHVVNSRRICRVPDMEATIIAQAAEIERLNEMLTVQWEGIPPHEKGQPG